jgi:hypothetical protein
VSLENFDFISESLVWQSLEAAIDIVSSGHECSRRLHVLQGSRRPNDQAR